ncbi:hypothetical protein MPH_04420 [Macrophomina phaseolina MS6]|uniref:Uncharacterized protein n=1 Tax=Macrophomina phaseolina (strain MS6) TaxID=1126212 RepID=K2RU63_MACPH|nr:hypothetical protein MPH_04420 [Macrophomina phaseolina MS6]
MSTRARYRKQLDRIRTDGIAISERLKKMIETTDELSSAFKATMDWDPTFHVNVFPTSAAAGIHTPSPNPTTTMPSLSATLPALNQNVFPATALSPISPISPLTVVTPTTTTVAAPFPIQAFKCTAQPGFIHQQTCPTGQGRHTIPRSTHHSDLFASPGGNSSSSYRCCHSAMSDIQPPHHTIEAAAAYHRPASLSAAAIGFSMMGGGRGEGARDGRRQQSMYSPMQLSVATREGSVVGREGQQVDQQAGQQGQGQAQEKREGLSTSVAGVCGGTLLDGSDSGSGVFGCDGYGDRM